MAHKCCVIFCLFYIYAYFCDELINLNDYEY